MIIGQSSEKSFKITSKTAEIWLFKVVTPEITKFLGAPCIFVVTAG